MCGCLSHIPNWRPGLQPRHVLWLGIEPMTLWFTARCSVHWAMPARAKISILINRRFTKSHLFWRKIWNTSKTWNVQNGYLLVRLKILFNRHPWLRKKRERVGFNISSHTTGANSHPRTQSTFWGITASSKDRKELRFITFLSQQFVLKTHREKHWKQSFVCLELVFWGEGGAESVDVSFLYFLKHLSF